MSDVLSATTQWSLVTVTLFMLVSCFAGAIALTFGVGFARDVVHPVGQRHVGTRALGVVLIVLGVLGWVLPWVIIWNWFRAH